MRFTKVNKFRYNNNNLIQIKKMMNIINLKGKWFSYRRNRSQMIKLIWLSDEFIVNEL